MRLLIPFVLPSSMTRILSSLGFRIAVALALVFALVAATWLVTGTELHVAAPMPWF